MALRFSRSQAKAYGLKVPKAKAVPPRERWDGYASSWEREYAAYLTQDPLVRSWQYESIRLILAPKTSYLPDFMCVDFRGKISIREVKGFAREAGMVRLKVAARLFPMFTFVLVRKVNGLWAHTTIKG